MYYQNEPGIYVYYLERVYYKHELDVIGELKLKCVYYKSIEDFIWKHNEDTLKNCFGYSPYDKICQGTVDNLYRRSKYHRRLYNYKTVKCGKTNCSDPEHRHNFNRVRVVYDHNGNLYTPDRLIGLRRKWLRERKSRYWYGFSGRKRRRCSSHRSMRTFQERKWAHAWDDEEFAPRVRAARQGKNLPDAWDDWHRHNDKCWKTQSKRKHQWKEKK